MIKKICILLILVIFLSLFIPALILHIEWKSEFKEQEKLYITSEEITNKTSVLIKGNIKANPFEIEIVDKNNVKLNNLGIFQRALYI